MSDEESFVVLSSDCADTSFVDQNSSLDLGIRENTQSSLNSTMLDSPNQKLVNATKQHGGTSLEKENGSSVETSRGISSEAASLKRDSDMKENRKLAASFILGEVGADVLKTSVYSQFPSMRSLEACSEDVVKLQNLMTEYVELKNTLAKVNGTMKQFYTKTQQWRDETQVMEQLYKQQIEMCQKQIADLRKENLELKRELNTNMEEMKLADEMRQKEFAELIREVSVKTAQLNNMNAQLVKIEQEQLTSFEYVRKDESDGKSKPDYVNRLEHDRIVKLFERQMSELLAENLDLRDMQKQYHSEIDCLKVNLTSAEELLKQSRSDINLLKAKDMEKSNAFSQYENDRDRMREEIALLRQHVDVYSKDFEMERVARQCLAGEKDELLNDLRALQRKNHSLIEETQKRVDEISQNTASSVPVKPLKITEHIATTSTIENEAVTDNGNLRCPICFKVFAAYTVLSSHVNDCLDQQKK